MGAAVGDAEGSWVAGSSSFVMVGPSGVAVVGSDEPCEERWGAEGVAVEWDDHAPGRKEVLLDVKGGADVTATAADAEVAYERMAGNKREYKINKWGK